MLDFKILFPWADLKNGRIYISVILFFCRMRRWIAYNLFFWSHKLICWDYSTNEFMVQLLIFLFFDQFEVQYAYQFDVYGKKSSSF